MKLQFDWTRVKNDVNGNPRYVCHFLALNTEAERNATGENWIPTQDKYAIACKRANRIGGRKFHNKQYGGGVVFQSYSLDETRAAIARVIQADEREVAQRANCYWIVDDVIGESGREGFEVMHGNADTAEGYSQSAHKTLKAAIASIPKGEPVYRVRLARRNGAHSVKRIA